MTKHGGLRVVVLGTMGTCPFGGQTWVVLNWLLGLMGNGHDVWYVEDDVIWPYHPWGSTSADVWTYAADHVRTCAEKIGLEHRWALRYSPDGLCWGLREDEVDELYRSADVLLNVIGTELREPHMAAPLRVWIQTDPVTDELLRAAGDESRKRHIDAHHAVATYGENYGAPDCLVPLGGVTYIPTRQPVDLEWWPQVWTPDATDFTTIGNYRQEVKDLEFEGRLIRWSKHHEWAKFMDLPARTDQAFRLCMNTNDADRDELNSKGWQVEPALTMSLDTFGAYPEFIRTSRAEFTAAKEQNVLLRSGWFSERDACYLASGKPVIAQDTAFGNLLPTGDGLFAVADLDDAVAAVAAINADYRHHCNAARELAHEYFDARTVTRLLLRDVGAL